MSWKTKRASITFSSPCVEELFLVSCEVLITFLSCSALAHQRLQRVPLMLYFCIMLVNTISMIKQRKLDLLAWFIVFIALDEK